MYTTLFLFMLYLPFASQKSKYYPITQTTHIMTTTDNARKDDVYRSLQNLIRSIRWDNYNLTENQQGFLETKLDEFKGLLDKEYSRS